MSTFDKSRVVGLDVDETLGYFSLLTQLGGLAGVVIPKENMKPFIRSFAYELWKSEEVGKTRFFRPGIPEFIGELADAFHSKKIKRVFILSNNRSDFMLKVVAEVINFYADPGRELPDLIAENDVFGLDHSKRIDDKKSLYAIRNCLGMDALLAGNIIFFDDIDQICSWQGCRFICVEKYEYITPVRAVTSTFFAELKKFDTSVTGDVLPILKSADSLAESIIEHWGECPKDYMLRGMALSEDDDLVPEVNHKDLKNTFVCEHMIPGFRLWLDAV